MTTVNEIRQANEIAIAILELEAVGYSFHLEGEIIRFTCEDNRPDPAYVKPRLALIKEYREQALDFLHKRAETFDISPYILSAIEKAEASARRAEKKGDLELARREWQRHGRLCNAYAEFMGVEIE